MRKTMKTLHKLVIKNNDKVIYSSDVVELFEELNIISERITYYACSFCGSRFSTKDDCGEHESDCLLNPTKKSCRTCKLYAPYIITKPYNSNQTEMPIIHFSCEKNHSKKILLKCSKWEINNAI
jgi:hypothetical protein